MEMKMKMERLQSEWSLFKDVLVDRILLIIKMIEGGRADMAIRSLKDIAEVLKK
jgi:hypothetical protein